MADKSYFITVGKLGTAVAFCPNLTGQFYFINQIEATFLEEGRFISKTKNGG